MSKKTVVKVYKDLMGANATWAAKTRAVLKKTDVRMINIIGSPGCGKTTLLERLTPLLNKQCRFAVLEGDIATTNDADRLAKLGVTAHQLLSGGACHLEAKLVHRALCDLPLDQLDLVIVENVGNMVCPAEFDIGEHGKVAVLSVTEGEDKPLKYPLLFHEASAVIITKIDLLRHVPFKLKTCLANVKKVNGRVPVFQVAALKATGLRDVAEWMVGKSK